MSRIYRSKSAINQEFSKALLVALVDAISETGIPCKINHYTSDYDGSLYWWIVKKGWFGKRLVLVDDSIERFRLHLYIPELEDVVATVAKKFQRDMVLEY